MPQPKTNAPAKVRQDQGRGERKQPSVQDELTTKTPRRKREGRYLYRVGPTGITVFDAWQWTGEPPLRRGA